MDADLVAQLRSFDGKSVEPFRRVAARLPATPATLADLVALATSDDDAVEIGSTWLVKRLLEGDVVADPPGTDALLELLPGLRRDESVLHVLQCLPMLSLDLDADEREALHDRILACTASKSAFVRAWAYNGLAVVAAGDPGRRDAVRALLDRVSQDETAAVKARIRHALRALESTP